MKINEAGLAIIKQFEGCRLAAYPDPGTGGEPWTIGYGHTGGVKRGQKITQAQADAFLLDDVTRFEREVLKLCEGVPTGPNQFSALVSFAFNCGPANLKKSTILREHRAGHYEQAAAAFELWNKAGGKVLAGLTRRRRSEAALYLKA